jgi:hypothetical protein
MAESHERLTGEVFEAKRQPGEQPEFHRGENKQSRHADEQKSETDKINQINIELFNMPVFAAVMPEQKLAEKPEPKNLESRLSFLDIIEMILEMIVDGAKAIFPKRKEKN